MFVDLNTIFQSQEKLDKTIHEKHNTSYKNFLDELKLALLVELGELANEIRCFKFWSTKDPSPKNVILEEYVDVIHFITSICVFLKVKPSFKLKNLTTQTNKKETTKHFNYLFRHSANVTKKFFAKKWYVKFLEFGFLLGFSIDEISSAYFKKHQINYQRQQNNY